LSLLNFTLVLLFKSQEPNFSDQAVVSEPGMSIPRAPRSSPCFVRAGLDEIPERPFPTYDHLSYHDFLVGHAATPLVSARFNTMSMYEIVLISSIIT
jgi:hypothetical protein